MRYESLGIHIVGENTKINKRKLIAREIFVLEREPRLFILLQFKDFLDLILRFDVENNIIFAKGKRLMRTHFLRKTLELG